MIGGCCWLDAFLPCCFLALLLPYSPIKRKISRKTGGQYEPEPLGFGAVIPDTNLSPHMIPENPLCWKFCQSASAMQSFICSHFFLTGPRFPPSSWWNMICTWLSPQRHSSYNPTLMALCEGGQTSSQRVDQRVKRECYSCYSITELRCLSEKTSNLKG